ncbi:MAG: DUF3783 domain-containing protein [Acetatifactor sp.]|nr:DUF3783 domain-containing protein [Acetatifactor sp.]
MKELVLYYAPEGTAHVGQLKGILSQMGIRIKNLTTERCVQKIGYLAGMEGFEKRKIKEGYGKYAPVMDRELLVLCGFMEERLDQLLENLKTAGIPGIGLKAVMKHTKADWTVHQLYRQLCEEYAQMKKNT